MKEITWNEFEQVELRVGTVVRGEGYEVVLAVPERNVKNGAKLA